ncbi:hypothetical protein DMUE_2457 [Dictyocoela muelleri]|nr:hypothetical protein DMUE_2457 [Dictyocoela muelleri]
MAFQLLFISTKVFFLKNKYNRVRSRGGTWYVAGVERNSKNAFIAPVVYISAETMFQLINKHVRPVTICISDEWRTYASAFNRIDNMHHYSVNHSISFVDPTNSEIHTNTIEGFFSHAKQYLRQKYCVDKEKVYEYLIYFIWIYKKEKNINTIINLINFNFSYFYQFLIFLKCVIFLKVCYKLREPHIYLVTEIIIEKIKYK